MPQMSRYRVQIIYIIIYIYIYIINLINIFKMWALQSYVLSTVALSRLETYLQQHNNIMSSVVC